MPQPGRCRRDNNLAPVGVISSAPYKSSPFKPINGSGDRAGREARFLRERACGYFGSERYEVEAFQIGAVDSKAGGHRLAVKDAEPRHLPHPHLDCIEQGSPIVTYLWHPPHCFLPGPCAGAVAPHRFKDREKLASESTKVSYLDNQDNDF